MGLLTKDQIKDAQDLSTEDVEVPEWGGTVRVRCMMGNERDAFEDSVFQGKGKDEKKNLKNFRARLLVLTLVDETNQRLFGDSEIEALGMKSAAALDRVFTVAQKLNGMGAKDVDEAIKN